MVNDESGCTAKAVSNEHLGDLIGQGENIGAQIRASDLPISDVLESRPPLGVEQGLVLEPVGNGLLGDGRTIQEAAQPVSKRCLAACNVDRALERSNVRFIHAAISYTSTLVKVNKPARVTNNKATCTVIRMPVRKQKLSAPATKPARKKSAKRMRLTPLVIGPDGRTANQRLRSVMQAKNISQADLLRLCNRIAGRAADADPIVSQGVLSNMQRDLDDLAKSQYVTVIAEAIGVRAMWLQYAIGPEKDERTISNEAREWAKKFLLENP
jgi:hypothetical protein